MLWGGRWEGGSCLGTHVRIKDFKIKKIKKIKRAEGGKGRNKKRERHGGNQSSDWLHPLLFRRPFILLIKHGDQWVTQSYAALAVQTHQNQAFLSAYLIVYTSLR